MPLKHAVLALVAERQGYGYDLAQRFEARVGPGWRLNASAIYPALDQLERAGLVASGLRRGGTRRSPRVVYTATRAGTAALDAWLGRTAAPPEPVRADLHLQLAFAGPRHRSALAAEAAACRRLLEEVEAASASSCTARGVIDLAVVLRMHAELAWLDAARSLAFVG
jgi:DNA-binding PadR family transcriptional regulator